uniref:Uncharacterized protein n=1 Tax=Mycobacterium riyadhense TaxID=486698 RepID=A0A653F1L1_9MYCO|nr:hypothetical protein BIN_B_04754 [Mycobacterium riyadhense]
MRPHLSRCHVQLGVQRLQKLGHVAMSDGHPFGDAGGARGVDDVGDIFGGRCWQARAWIGGNPWVIDIDYRQVAVVQLRPQVCRADGGDRSSIGNHERDPGRRRGRVDGQVRRPGFEHRPDRHDCLSRSGKQQCHTLTRARALSSQQMRQPVRYVLNLSVSPRAVAAAQRHRFRGAGDLLGENRRNRHRRRRLRGQDCPVPPHIEAGPLAAVQ